MLNSFPDDVSIRTSDNHGKEIKILYQFWEEIANTQLDHDVDNFWPFIIDITDEIQGSLFNLLHGYYRVSASCLRNALELSLYGLYFQTMDNYDNAFKWLSGGNEDLQIFSHIQGLGNVCNQLTKPKQFNQLNFILKKKTRIFLI